jgi:hypothetical protein
MCIIHCQVVRHRLPKKEITMRMETLHWARLGCLLFLLAGPCVSIQAQRKANSIPVNQEGAAAVIPSDLMSSTLARVFLEMAEELIYADRPTQAQLERAMVLVVSARSLNYTGDSIQILLLDLVDKWPHRDYSQYVMDWVNIYYNEAKNTGLLRRSIDYIVSRMKYKKQQEQFLRSLIIKDKRVSHHLRSDLKTQLGLMYYEQPDPNIAKSYLREAWNDSKYNQLAFDKLMALAPDEVTPQMHFEHLRYVVQEDPLNMQAALDFAQYAERLEIYSIAAGGYQYSVDLYRYLNPGQPLPSYLYLPWAMSCHNSQQKRHQVFDIAESIRTTGKFDIFLEAIVMRTADALKDYSVQRKVQDAVERKATQLLESGPQAAEVQAHGTPVGPMQIAWFYCFADPDDAKALEWANRAYTLQPDSPMTAALLSFARVINDRIQWAQKPLEGKEPSQISELALAQVYLSQDNPAQARDFLMSAIARDPGSLAANYGKNFLVKHGGTYVPMIKAGEMLTRLAERFEEHIVPDFVDPAERMSIRFTTHRSQLAYGEKINGVVTLANHTTEPLVISDRGLFNGHLRVHAAVTGDLTVSLPDLVTRQIPVNRHILPGRSAASAFRLDAPGLRRILDRHPQANLTVEFSLHVDPRVGDTNDLRHRSWLGREPIVVSVSRPGVVVEEDAIHEQFNAIALAPVDSRVETGRLFLGLLKEQQAMADTPLYRYRYAAWLPGRLTSAFSGESGLLRSNDGQDWETVALILTSMRDMTLGPELSRVIAKHLHHEQWPLRLLAIYLLSGQPGDRFREVLTWMDRNDSHVLVKDMARTFIMTD